MLCSVTVVQEREAKEAEAELILQEQQVLDCFADFEAQPDNILLYLAQHSDTDTDTDSSPEPAPEPESESEPEPEAASAAIDSEPQQPGAAAIAARKSDSLEVKIKKLGQVGHTAPHRTIVWGC